MKRTKERQATKERRVTISISMASDSKEQLRDLAYYNRRNLSGMVEVLIRNEYKQQQKAGALATNN